MIKQTKNTFAFMLALASIIIFSGFVSASSCGDNICSDGETCSTCSLDCGCCPSSELCGDGIIQNCEECDKGVTLNGQVCTPLYGSSCNYCSDSCISITLEGPYCGDGICNGAETCSNCSCDCGICPPPQPYCGDGICNNGETCNNCSHDCGICPPPQPYCGDDICNNGETCNNCSTDCGICPPSCGDGQCNGLETCSSCSGDCGICPPSCGDGQCNGLETCSSCSGDCGICPPTSTCGDCVCNSSETCSSCPRDCGVCRAVCGNGIKEAGEECDDGNYINNDGCSRLCKTEDENCDNNCEDDNECNHDCKKCYDKDKTIILNNLDKFCEAKWSCSEWGECVDGVMTRKCVDESNCYSEYNKPSQQTFCAEEQASSLKLPSIYDVKTGNYIWVWVTLGLIFFVLLVLVLLMLIR
jgi:cysteine-rich repeat protein